MCVYLFVHVCITDTDAVHIVQQAQLSTPEIPGVTLRVCVLVCVCACVHGRAPVFGGGIQGKVLLPPSSLLSAQQCAYRLLTYHLAVCTCSLTWLVGVFPSGVEASPEGSPGELQCALSGSLSAPVLSAVATDQPGAFIQYSASTNLSTCRLSG